MIPISTIRSVRNESSGDLTLNFQIHSNLKEVFSGWIVCIRGHDHGEVMCYESELGNGTKSRTHNLVRWEFATATTAGQNSVDGDGDQRLEAAGGEEDDPETSRAEQAIAQAKGFGEISKILPVSIYSPTLSV